MRILIDAHYLGSRAGGNETYTANLLAGLRRIHPPHAISALVNKELHGLEGAAAGFPTVPLASHSAYLRVPFLIPLAARGRADLLHVQYTAPPWAPCPYVVTMHDLVAFKLPESMPFVDRHRLRLFTENTLRRARRIFTVTEAMKREIATHCDIDPDRIDVTPNALARGFAPVEDAAQLAAVRARYALPERFVLYLGLLQPRKNLVRLAAAFQQLARRGLDHTLVIAGRRAWMHEEIFRGIAALGLGDRVRFTDYVAQEDLPALYSAADAFAFVSLYEGFGIPVIEALACGTPVVASTDPALVEVAGGAAIHCDPHSTDAIADGLAQALTDATLRARLRPAGIAHARTYTVERLAGAALTGYERALAH